MSGSLVLYSAIACNDCHRVRAVLAAERAAAELVEIDGVRRPDWHRKKSSRGAVPLLEADGRELHGSAVNLEERFPDPPLLPQDAGERAAARMWIAWANTAPTQSLAAEVAEHGVRVNAVCPAEVSAVRSSPATSAWRWSTSARPAP
jgi:glutathione S-transferase